MAGVVKACPVDAAVFHARKAFIVLFRDTCRASGPDPGPSSCGPDIWLVG